MSRWEFMRVLEELLADISPSEREEALQYYNDYINDAGKENEAAVLASLGTPEQVAAIVKEGLEGQAGEFTEKGFQGTRSSIQNPITRYERVESPHRQEEPEQKKPGLSPGIIVLLVIVGIIASPAILGLVTGIFGVLVGCFAAIFALIVAFGAVAVSLIAAAVFLVVIGIGEMIYAPLIGLALIAAALIIAGIGILFLLLTVLIVGSAIPAIVKGIGYLSGKIFHKKGGYN